MKQIGLLVQELEYELLQGSLEGEISELVYDTRKVTKDAMFVCIVGTAFDSHTKAAEVAAAGAKVLIVSKEVEVPTDVTVIKVADTRYALALISAAYFDHPARTLKVIGITGTKGKTTTTFMIKSILENAGYKVGLIGTIETIIGEEHIPANNTTPESYIVQEYFAKMLEAGCQICVMEVSSQGLMMHRTAGIPFEIGIFTNLAPDHIGPNEHASFEEYAECKGMLFRQCKVGIANADDENLEMVMKNHTCALETIGFSEKAGLRAGNVNLVGRPGYLGVTYDLSGLLNFPVEIDIPGKFSVYNSLVAIAVCRHFEIQRENILEALKSAKAKEE